MWYNHIGINKKDLLPQDAYNEVGNFVEQFIVLNTQANKESAFKTFMEKINAAEKAV